MKLQLETYGKKYTVETDYDDITADEYFEMFKGILVQASFMEQTINDTIIELADQLKE